MSVNNPSDSGGGGGPNVAFANPPSMTEMDMGTMGAWAEIMAEEQVQPAPPTEKNDENEIREQNIGDVEDVTRKGPEQQTFAVQVTNLPACTNEELFYHFGGDGVVRDVTFLKDHRFAARIDFTAAEGLKSAKGLDGQIFRGRTLRVYEIREERVRERPSQQDLQNRQYSNEPPSYNRDNSRYNSQSSLYSNDARSYERSNRSYNNSNDYRGNSQYRGPPMGGTFPRGGKFYNTYDDYNMGRYPQSGGQPYRGNGPYYHNAPYGGGGYAPRARGMQNRGGGYSGGRGNYYGSQELQRSDSYHHDEREKPGPISRSRTESTAFDPDRRRMELSRTSSRLSTSTEDMETAHRVAPKKLTNKDIFGEAKPVDTSERLREIEAKQERERLLEQQKYKVTEEAEAARLAAAAEHPEGAPPHHHQHQYGSHHGHVPRDGIHHPAHHQYHHAPSRPPIPPHASYGPYHPPHNASQHPQQPPTNAGQFHPQQRYEPTGPGSYRIMRRESTDATDASPPLDPVHAKAPLQSQSAKETERVQEVSNENTPAAASVEAPVPPGRRDSGSDRRRGNDANMSGSETMPRPAAKQRVVYNSNNSKFVPLQKSATIGEIRDAAGPQRGRGVRGGRGGRGFNRGGAASDRRSSFSGAEKPAAAPPITGKPAETEGETVERKPSTEMRTDRPERKDYHGSHASLRSGRAGTLRKNRGGGAGFVKDRTPRDSRESDGPWSGDKVVDGELHKEQSKPSEEPSDRQNRVEEKGTAAPPKKEVAKSPPSTAAPAAATSSSTSVQDKKKEKKKTNKREVTKGGKTLNNNKFALLIDSED